MTTAAASALRLDSGDLASALPIAEDALAEFRRAAAASLASGLPDRRVEDWKYTSLKHLGGTAFSAAPETADASAANREVLPGLDPSSMPSLTIVDGRLVREASNLDGLPAGVTVRPMSELASEGGGLASRLGTANERWQGVFFEALNAAAFTEGLVLHVAANTSVDTPILVRVIDTGADGPRLLCPRSLVVAEQSSSVTIIEDHVGLDDAAETLLVSLIEVHVAANARVHHLRLGREGRATTAVPMIRARLDRDAHFESHVGLFGGRVVRNEINPVLAGPNCECVLNGLLVPMDDQHVDNHMRVEHRVPHCRSRQYYKAILNDASTGAFTGRIVVDDDASGTDAVQSSESLVLGDKARAIVRPQLEIYDFDVKCTHGATIGQLDRDALFYLEARGVPREQARGLLVFAFASDVLERFGVDAIERASSSWLRERIPFARGIEDLD